MRLYVTGADGMLGAALRAALCPAPGSAEWTVRGVSVTDFDIADSPAVTASITRFRPDVVVHAAAHAVVDDCERDPARAMRVNVAGVRNVVEACRRTGSRLIYISSDYVFDGRDTPAGGYREDDTPNPVSVYGLTKLAGERIVATLPEHLTVRTSWLFGGTDERLDAVLAMVRRLTAGERPTAVADQRSAPTYTADLAQALAHLLRRPRLTGTVHVANAGGASWYEVATHLATLMGVAPDDAFAPQPVALADCGHVGARPVDSTLDTGRLYRLGHRMPSWQDAVERFHTALGAPRRPALVTR